MSGVAEVWTVAQVADYLGVTKTTVYAYRRDRILPDAVMVGRTPTWYADDIRAWNAARRPGCTPKTE